MSSKNFARGIMGAAAMAGLVSFVERSAAADYWGSSQDGDPALPAEKVEFASNWYVRGDLAYAQETFPKIAPDFSFDASPSVLNTYSAGAGAGYKVNTWFRTDLILDYRSRVQAAGIGEPKSCAIVLNDPLTGKPTQLDDTCAGHFNTEIHRWDLLANGYVDLVTWGGFTPYIGAGAGVTWARTKQSVNWTIINGVPCQASCGFTTNGSNFYNTLPISTAAGRA